jgi:hypothetical protein
MVGSRKEALLGNSHRVTQVDNLVLNIEQIRKIKNSINK